ncbi:MAG: hypothetical protein KA477_02450 [Candidatus Levybacteria bacterium]|nr:hypothetical protein [Candidatus Levybacteria bacterium]
MKLIKKMIRGKKDQEVKDYYQIGIEKVGKQQLQKMRKIGLSIPILFS